MTAAESCATQRGVTVEARTVGLLLGLAATACLTARPTPIAPARPAGPVVPDGFVSYPEPEAAHVANPHLYRGRPLCQACHVLNSAQLLLGHECGGCHQTPHSEGHDVGTPLVRKVKVELPLVDGKIACHTCHDPHDLKRQRFGLRKELNALCRDCHPRH